MTQQSGSVRVLIPTTEGPTTISNLQRETTALGESLVVVAGTNKLAHISDAYDAFVGGPNGVVERHFGGRAWRLELSRNIDTGRSWEAGVILAHALRNAGRLATGDAPADLVVWTTGVVEQPALNIGAVDYVDVKLREAIALLGEQVKSGTCVTIAIPRANLEELDQGLVSETRQRGIGIVACDTCADLTQLVGVRLTPLPAHRTRQSRSWRHGSILVAVLAVFILGAHQLLTSKLPKFWLPKTNAPKLPPVSFRDCEACPEMIELPPIRDELTKRPTETASEPPRRSSRRIAMAKYEVTIAEYEAFVQDTQHEISETCNLPMKGGVYGWGTQKATFRNPSYAAGPRHPVTCVSWDDAMAFAAWVAKKSGRRYRLPDASEWEYAARAGTSTQYSFGDSEEELCAYGRFAHSATPIGKARGVETSCPESPVHGPLPVGSLKPNPWGLYDMHGNVWEWVADCAQAPSTSASLSPPPTATENCTIGVIRGGAYNNFPAQLRSEHSETDPRGPRGRSDAKGLRLVLGLDE